ncbi:hypothetical protein ABIA14_004448 [Sinorhizobium fredii]
MVGTPAFAQRPSSLWAVANSTSRHRAGAWWFIHFGRVGASSTGLRKAHGQRPSRTLWPSSPVVMKGTGCIGAILKLGSISLRLVSARAVNRYRRWISDQKISGIATAHRLFPNLRWTGAVVIFLVARSSASIASKTACRFGSIGSSGLKPESSHLECSKGNCHGADQLPSAPLVFEVSSTGRVRLRGRGPFRPH